MNQTRYRIILSLLGLALAALIAGFVILAPSGEHTELPDAVVGFTPADGANVARQTKLQVDLQPGYTLILRIDGMLVPADQIDVTEATGRHVFRPGDDKVITEWTPGFHVVEIEFDRTVGLPDPGSLRWSFRTL